jgi:predicted transcriptional regulator
VKSKSARPQPVAPDSDEESDEDDVIDEDRASAMTSAAKVAATAAIDGEKSQSTPSALLGHSVETLEKLLSPGRWSDGKKFEISVDGVTFVGHPVYAFEDGRWNKDEHDAGKTPRPGDETEGSKFFKATARGKGRSFHDYSPIPGSLDSYMGPSLGTSMDSTSTTSGVVADQINMFHVVFVLKSSAHLAKDETFAMYNDHARRLSRALHYCQKEYNYVTEQTRRLTALKLKVKSAAATDSDSWARMIETSELAWALQEIYFQTRKGEIASFRLHGMEISLQLKNRFPSDRTNDHADSKELSPFSALLLLVPKQELLAELLHTDSLLLASFIRELKPTKNLLKHAAMLGAPIKDVLYLAHHLIKWRKARLLRMPLHQRNIYAISSTAPLSDLDVHMAEYELRFPGHLPSLPSMLRVLSGKAIHFGQLPPSRDHRIVYMDILAFLVKHGFVKQVLTHGWLRVPLNYEPPSSGDEHEKQDRTRPFPIASLLSPHLRAAPDDDETISVSSERTALPPTTPASRPSTATTAHRSNQRLSTATQFAIPTIPGPGEERDAHAAAATATASTIILSPSDPSSGETRLISKVKRGLAAGGGDAEKRGELLELMLPHLDGDHCLEEIAAAIGRKRARVEECLAELEGQGLLARVRIMEGE